MSRGVEKLIHACRAAFESGWLVGKNDFENGFNSLSRQKMLDAHCAAFPEATDIFGFFYGIDAPIFVLDDDLQVTVLLSKQGSRQGCTLGTEAFCIAVHPVVARLQEMYPDFVLRILTDDLVPLCPPPLVDCYEGWQDCYRRYAHFINDLNALSLSLTLNAGKSGLLLQLVSPQMKCAGCSPPLLTFREMVFVLQAAQLVQMTS